MVIGVYFIYIYTIVMLLLDILLMDIGAYFISGFCWLFY
jgi:hypothetical protein